ncbi:hypothetical protein [Geodermatophilus sp. DSM 44513]|uniref:hypothetical protein n=1 Tax=Geodermatophilus sp. DSM 44513 TaxID=1528104 RepID=UPI0012837584|nr:hypothetical protein [Geodermatophilus sp. DSM 44513]WNV75772.1 hypothetical protein RTG05_00500 [Geodermatophilus sp. DSM 44513]
MPGTTRLLLHALGVPALSARPGRLNVSTARGFDRALVGDWLRPARTDAAVRADLTAFLRTVRPGPLVAAAVRAVLATAPKG